MLLTCLGHLFRSGASFARHSYHASAGNLLVMDIQGVRTETMYDLTDPACHSAGEGGLFGEVRRDRRGLGWKTPCALTRASSKPPVDTLDSRPPPPPPPQLDLGDRGIRAFFLTHECNGLCRGLLKPQVRASEGRSDELMRCLYISQSFFATLHKLLPTPTIVSYSQNTAPPFVSLRSPPSFLTLQNTSFRRSLQKAIRSR